MISEMSFDMETFSLAQMMWVVFLQKENKKDDQDVLTRIQRALDERWPPDGKMSGCMCGEHIVAEPVLTGTEFRHVLLYMVQTHLPIARKFNWMLVTIGMSALSYA